MLENWMDKAGWFFGGMIVPTVAFLIKYSLPWIQEWKLGRGERQAGKTIKKMLETKKWTFRTYSVIERRTLGIDEETRRRILTEIGAISFGAAEGRELWCLRDRANEALDEDGSFDETKIDIPHENK